MFGEVRAVLNYRGGLDCKDEEDGGHLVRVALAI